MTHGEVYVFSRENLDFTHDIDRILRNFERLPKRMKRADALKYYGDKIRNVFRIEEVKSKDFRHIEEFYDYHEALRLKKDKTKDG